MALLYLHVFNNNTITPMQIDSDERIESPHVLKIKSFLKILLHDDTQSATSIFLDCEKHQLHFEPMLENKTDNVYELIGVAQSSMMLKRIPTQEITIVDDTTFERNFAITTPKQVKDLYGDD